MATNVLERPISIEKDVPCPALYGRGFNAKYPFREMEVGDSFFVATDQPQTHTLRRTASMHGQRSGTK